jgi:hypothetical protein
MDTGNDKRLLNRQEASTFLGEHGYRVAVASLNKWASVGAGRGSGSSAAALFMRPAI